MEKTKNILVVDSGANDQYYIPWLLDSLYQRGYSFFLLSTSRNKNLFKKFQEKKWHAKKIHLGPEINNPGSLLWFIVLSPINLIKIFFRLLYCRYKKQIRSVICINTNEKILFSLVAKLLGIKVIWLENTNLKEEKNIFEKIIFSLLKILSKKITIFVFSEKDKNLLERHGIKKENIEILNHALDNEQKQFQKNIFNEITNSNQVKSKNNFFTIGTITSLEEKQKIETILKAVKIAKTITPKIQLIVIGDGKEKKNLNWITKKMEIDGAVWFVGEQAHIAKWVNNFNALIVSTEKPNMDDAKNTLLAMNASLPILGPRDEGLEDILPEKNKDFLMDMNDVEKLAQLIIKIQQEKTLREQIGKLNKEKISNYLTIENQVEKISKIL